MPERLFAALAARPAGRPLLIGADQPWPAGQLLAAADDLAARLRQRDSRVLAVLADNSPAWVAADLAALRAPVVHLPLPPFFNLGQWRHALDTTAADTLLTDRSDLLAAGLPDWQPVDRWCGLQILARRVAPAALPAGTAKISFTSGSTGTPKGVCLSATGLVDRATALAQLLDDLSLARHLAVLPLALLLENVAGIYGPLLRGMEVHLPPLAALGWQGMSGLHIGALEDQVAARRPESLILVPEVLKAWTCHLEARDRQAPRGLRFVAVGGARCDAALIGRARRHGLPAHEGYGLTECGSVVTLNRPGADWPGSVGRPLPGVELSIDDGEVRVAGHPFLGYLGDDGPAPGPWATGDLGRIADQGHLYLSGRRRHLIVTGYGRNVSPEWVEGALLAQPAIAQALVAGEARPWLAALLVPAAGAGAAELAAAVAAANAGLPDYARVAGWLATPPFLAADGLATGNGRPRRNAILDRHQADLERLYLEKTP